MRKTKRVSIAVLITAVFLILALSVSCANVGASKTSGKEALSLWTSGATEGAPRDRLIAYVEAVTDPSSDKFIPQSDRIAVFDFDGTLFNETDPYYFDHMLLMYRVTEDEEYRNKASAQERAVAAQIIDLTENGTKYPNLPLDHGQAVASMFRGMTPEEIYAYIGTFKETSMPSYTGMKRGDGYYKPMLQVLEYLEANGFTIYIVSGTDRLIMRGIFSGDVPFAVPSERIIGSDETLVGKGQGGKDGYDYQFSRDDKLVTGGEFVVKNLNMNKVSAIYREIGKQPVLAFGNSGGDESMLNYTITGNKYEALAFMLCCDDLERENGNLGKADAMYKKSSENGWIPVSMKNDWTTIYGDGVTYTPVR